MEKKNNSLRVLLDLYSSETEPILVLRNYSYNEKTLGFLQSVHSKLGSERNFTSLSLDFFICKCLAWLLHELDAQHNRNGNTLLSFIL